VTQEQGVHSFNHRLRLLPALLVTVAAAPPALADVKFTTVCAYGMDAPGGIYSGLEAGPRITHSGLITFKASYEDGPHLGYFGWRDGQAVLFARHGQEAPGLPPTIPPHPYFDAFGDFFYGGDDGSFIFNSRLAGTDINNTNDGGVWASGPDGVLQLVIWKGDQAPGMPDGAVFVRWFDFEVAMGGGVGVVFAYTQLPNDKERRGIWQWKDGQTTKVAAIADAAPGTDETFTVMGNPTIDDSGIVRFIASTDPKNIDNGMWRTVGDTLEPVVLPGDPIPDGTAFFRLFPSSAVVSHNGNTAADIWLSGPGVEYPRDRSLFVFGQDGPVQIVRGGDPVTDGEPGEYFLTPEVHGVNDAGQTVFMGTAQVGFNITTGIWIGDGQSMTTIAREFQQAPGFDDGWVFSAFDGNTPAVIDSAGRVCFSMQLQKPGESNRFGLWTWTPDDGLQPIVVTGDSIEVTPGDFQTVRFVGLWNSDPVRGTAGGGEGGRLALDVRFFENPNGAAAIVADLGVDAPCAPDCDGNALLDLFDFLCFVNAFNAEDPGADCTQDEVFDLFDFLCFVNQFNAGC
jgi:hypothetical protein